MLIKFADELILRLRQSVARGCGISELAGWIRQSLSEEQCNRLNVLSLSELFLAAYHTDLFHELIPMLYYIQGRITDEELWEAETPLLVAILKARDVWATGESLSDRGLWIHRLPIQETSQEASSLPPLIEEWDELTELSRDYIISLFRANAEVHRRCCLLVSLVEAMQDRLRRVERLSGHQ